MERESIPFRNEAVLKVLDALGIGENGFFLEISDKAMAGLRRYKIREDYIRCVQLASILYNKG